MALTISEVSKLLTEAIDSIDHVLSCLDAVNATLAALGRNPIMSVAVGTGLTNLKTRVSNYRVKVGAVIAAQALPESETG